MDIVAKITSLVALSLVVFPCLIYFFSGAISLDAVKWTALAGTIGWFLATPIWMRRDSTSEPNAEPATGPEA